VVDGDTVSENNLHRQVGHAEERCGANKAASLASAVRALNSRVDCVAYGERLTPASTHASLIRYRVAGLSVQSSTTS
jgi:molybdopterin/thiamine biosynthesis adenylyltransferase